MGQEKNNVIALVNAENNRNIPSEAYIEFEKPLSADKIYLLTANLTKPCKSYYPAAEMVILYDEGAAQTIQLIPPYNIPSLVQAFCPGAYQIPLGKIENNQVFHDKGSPGLSVTDITTDPSRKISGVTIRCVASETVIGIIGITLNQVK